jgi:hypothetical protein
MAERVIVSNLEVLSGIPCFRGTRVPFKSLIDCLEGGHSLGDTVPYGYPRDGSPGARGSKRIALRPDRVKILLDECLPLDFRYSFPGHGVYTSVRAGLAGKKNGDLLRDAELAGYEVLLTVDQGLPHQQNLAGRKLSTVTIRSRTNQIEDLLPFVDAILKAFEAIGPGQTQRIG